MNNIVPFKPRVFQQLEQLRQDAAKWEQQAARSNQRLYEILATCLELYRQIRVDTDAESKLTGALQSSGLRCKSTTPLATKIAYYVFNSDRRRSYSYGRVISVAEKQNVAPSNLPDWIKNQGGVEEIRLLPNSAIRPLRKSKLIEVAKAELATVSPIISGLDLPASVIVNATPGFAFSVVLIRKNKSGKGEIVWSNDCKTLIKKILYVAGQKYSSDAARQTQDQADRVRAEKKASIIRTITQKQSDNSDA